MKRTIALLCSLSILLLTGCGAGDDPAKQIRDLAREENLENVFAKDTTTCTLTVGEQSLGMIELPKTETDPKEITEADGVVEVTTGDQSFFVQLRNGSSMTVSDFVDMYPEGTAFTWEDHACYLLGPGNGYTGVRLGDLTVYYELDETTGAYVAFGYEGPFAELAEEQDLADLLCDWIHPAT